MIPTGASVVCERVVKIYRIGTTHVTALAGLDFRVDAGEMVGIIGPSGCGKTTLLNLIGALIRPTSGRVSVDDQELAALSTAEIDHYRRSTVGFVWQDTARTLVPYLNALDNAARPLFLDRAPAARSRALDLLDLVGLRDRARHRPSQLSGGQQQRTAIAVALANSPSLLLADEPTGALDGATARDVYDVLRVVNRELGVTMVIVSHDPNMATIVDRVVELRDGQSAVEHRADRDPEDEHMLLLVDTVGRVRVPDEFRDLLGIGERVEAHVEDGRLLLSPYEIETDRQAEEEADD
jgi:ABC-type lipoprotein export system ATPase subunit